MMKKVLLKNIFIQWLSDTFFSQWCQNLLNTVLDICFTVSPSIPKSMKSFDSHIYIRIKVYKILNSRWNVMIDMIKQTWKLFC